jgi:hypothetical protein
MPVIDIDGKKVFVPEGTSDPESAARRTLKSVSGGESFLGEVGRGIGAGLVGIPQGIATLGSTIVDGVFDTDLTDSLNKYFEEFKPETNSTAGHIAQYITQFGIPGIGVASALSKAGKTAQILSAGAVDAAVATDDVETLSDLFFDEVSDQERLASINGSEAAASRLLERVAVFGETAGIVGALPVALKALAKTGKATVDVAGVAAAPLVKAVASSPVTTAVTNRLMPSTGQKFTSVEDAINERSNSFMDFVKDRFTFQGGLVSDDIAQLKEAQVQETRRQLAQVEQDFGEVMTTIKKAGVRGTLNATDQDNLAKAIGDYYSPLTKLSYRDDAMEILADPNLKRKVAEDIQNRALQVIKSYEDGVGNKIDYKALGIPDNQKISTLLEQQREIVDLNSKAIDDFAKDFDNTFIPEDYGNILKDNYLLYTNRSYKAMIDNSYVVDPEQKAKAITELENALVSSGMKNGTEAERKILRANAEKAFDDFTSGKADAFQFESPQGNANVLTGAVRKDILKGRTLDNLPEVRKALGEVAGYLEQDWSKSLANTQLQAFQTVKKQANLVGRVQLFDDLNKLNKDAQLYDIKPFIFDEQQVTGLGVNRYQPGESFEVGGKEFVKFDDKAGPLAGKVASKRFYDALLDSTGTRLDNIYNALGTPYKTFLSLKSAAQYNKTVLSPSAQIRNPTGGILMTLAAGNIPGATTLAKAFGKVFNRFNKDPDKNTFAVKPDKDLIASETVKLKKLGIIDDSAAAMTGEIEDLAKFAEQSNFVGKVANSKLIKGFRNSGFNKGARKAYTGSDSVIRVVNFYQERDTLLRALLKHGDSAIPVTSVKNKTAIQGTNVTGNQLLGAENVAKLREAFETKPIKKGNIEKFLDDNLGNKELKNKFMSFLDEESAQLAKNHYQNYNRVGNIVGDLAKLPIGNFAAFPSEIIRTMGNIGYRAAQELASGNPELQKKGMKRAVSALTVTTAFPAAMVELGTQLTGADREQIDAYKRSFAPPWDKTATLVPTGTDSQGNITQMMNLSYTNPYDYLSRPFSRLIAEAEEGEAKGESLVNRYTQGFMYGLYELTKPYGTLSISTQLLRDTVIGETETGRRLYSASDTFGDKATKAFVHNLQGMAPPILPFDITSDPAGGILGIGASIKDFPTAVFNSTGLMGDDKLINRKGNRIDPAEALVQGFSGLKIIKPQIGRTLRYRGFETNDVIRAAANEFNRVARSANVREAEDFTKAYIESNEGRYRGMRDLYLAIEDARLLGLSEQEILKELKTAKVANADYVMAGLFKPSELSKEVITEAYREDYNKARNFLPTSDIGFAQRQLTGQSLEGGYQTPQEIADQVKPTRTNVAPQPSALRQQELNKLLGID